MVVGVREGREGRSSFRRGGGEKVQRGGGGVRGRLRLLAVGANVYEGAEEGVVIQRRGGREGLNGGRRPDEGGESRLTSRAQRQRERERKVEGIDKVGGEGPRAGQKG